MGIFDRFKRKTEEAKPEASFKVDLSLIDKAIAKRGKAPLRAMMISQLTRGFAQQAKERIEKGQSLKLDDWLTEYHGDKDYKTAKVMLGELDIGDSDVLACMENGINGGIGSPVKAIPTPENHFYGTPRNSLCPCGSGKKYKRCCGAL